MKKIFTVLVLLGLLAVALQAEDIRVIVPYLGAATNLYENPDYAIDWDDTKLMEGLFFQWVNPDRFQANAFIYHSADINYSQLWGGHVIADFYIWSNPLGKAAVGAGVEVISLGTHAGDVLNIAPQFVNDFNLPLTLYVPYARAGHYFNFGSRSKVLLSIFPWAGAQYEITRGHLSLVVDPNGAAPPPPEKVPVDQSIEEDTLYGIAGLGLSATIFHFIELQAKYKATFNADDLLHTVDGMANVFFTRHWGLSYRFKYMQTTDGSTSYHIGGIAYVF
jgi:hypothetical protein